jgi:hypothetical protein
MYVETILTDETTTVDLDQTVVVSRARTGLHLILSQLAEQVLDKLIERDGIRASRFVMEYVSRATGIDLEEVDARKVLRAFLKLERFNRLRVNYLSSLKQPPSDGAKVAVVDFPGRQYATWVHRLGSRYGWTRHYIFDQLMPEEVMIYLQEIAISELDELDIMRQAHEVFYEYDKTTHVGRYKPIERPGWMVPGALDKPKEYRVAVDSLPAGMVLNYSDFAGVHVNEVDY